MHVPGAARHWEKGTRWGEPSAVGAKEVMENRPQGNVEATEGLEDMASLESRVGGRGPVGEQGSAGPLGQGLPPVITGKEERWVVAGGAWGQEREHVFQFPSSQLSKLSKLLWMTFF